MLQNNYLIYYARPCISGSHNVKANSAKEALEMCREKYPNQKYYAACFFDPSQIHPFVIEDLPEWEYRSTKIQSTGYGNDIASELKILYDDFCGWHKDYGYFGYNDAQLALISLRTEVIAWSNSLNHPAPSMAWATVYNCGTGDWNSDRLLEYASKGNSVVLKYPENREKFLDFVKKVHQITGIRPCPCEAVEIFSGIGILDWHKSIESAEKEKAEIVDWFEKTCLKLGRNH